MLNINTNISALNAQRHLDRQQTTQSQALQRLSSGLRINSARDDAAGLAISNRMTSQINGFGQAVRNANDGISLLQTAESALEEVTNGIQRIRDLALQAASDTLSASDRASLQAEVKQRLNEINRTNDTTTFGGRKLFQHAGSSDFDEQNRSAVVMGLAHNWLSESEARIEDFFGIRGDNQILRVNLDFTDGAGSVAASVSGYVDTDGRTIGQTLNVDMADFSPANLPNGGTSPFYNDRTIAHEMVHAVMGRAMDVSVLPGWFKEGSSEFIHGADERLSNDIAASSVGAVVGAFGSIANSQGYSASYAAVRYMHSEIKAAGGNGIKDIMTYLASNSGVDLDDALTNASSGAFASEADFNSSFSTNGATFINGLDLTNEDTGAIGGFDADDGSVFTAESIIPNAENASEQPLKYFKLVMEDAYAQFGGENYNLQIGAGASESLDIEFGAFGTWELGLQDIDLTQEANNVVALADTALKYIDSRRADLGAAMNRLESTINNLTAVQESLSESRSRVRDADFANETATLSKTQVLNQAGISVLAQANANPNQVLALL